MTTVKSKKEVIKYHSQILLLIASNVITIISTASFWNVIVQYNNIRYILSRGAVGSQNILLNIFLTKWINKNTVLMCSRFLCILFPFFYDIFVFNNKILYNICLDRHLLYVTLLFGFRTTTAKKSKSSSLDMLFLLSHWKYTHTLFLPRLWHFLHFMLMLFFLSLDPSGKIYSCDFLSCFSYFLCLHWEMEWNSIHFWFEGLVLFVVETFLCYLFLWYVTVISLIWIFWKLKIQQSIIFLMKWNNNIVQLNFFLMWPFTLIYKFSLQQLTVSFNSWKIVHLLAIPWQSFMTIFSLDAIKHRNENK